MAAYYSENNPFAVQVLRNLIAAGEIADGIVDDRDIRDVRPSDLRGFDQHHFFAGIGVWSYALRQAGWSDSRACWTGSCPCQPFSAAGRMGGFADVRHLWPEWFYLISQYGPSVVFGEQVASKEGLSWLDLVHDDLEGTGYAVGATDSCAASVGAPHIRQRLYFCGTRFLGDAFRERLEGHAGYGNGARGWTLAFRPAPPTGTADQLADADSSGRKERSGEGPASLLSGEAGPQERVQQPRTDSPSTLGRGPVNGFWRDADWISCRDGKWRSVEPGASPLAARTPATLGLLHAYGNSIVAPQAEKFIRECMEFLP